MRISTTYFGIFANKVPITNGKFTFTLAGSAKTSAGVFKTDGTLVKTLWNDVQYPAGTHTEYWNSLDDLGLSISSPDVSYQIKVLSNNVNYTWQGTVGNTSTNQTGPTKHRGVYHCMRGLAFNGSYGYFCIGYAEGNPTILKFNVATPNIREYILPEAVSPGDVNFVAVDSTNAYWGCYNHDYSGAFVYATSISGNSLVTFPTYGTNINVGNTTVNGIGQVNDSNGGITGLAVQKTGNKLFVARAALNQLQVMNKTTGQVLQTLTYTSPKGLSIDSSDNLWMITGTNTVSKYTVNTDGTLTAATLTLSGLIRPLSTQVSFDGTLISVADGSTSQQVKFFNNSTGASTSTLGTAGGYSSDANVSDSKFYFDDVNGSGLNEKSKQTFIAFQSDGSFWVNDPGNFRVQHYNSSRVFVDRIMSLGSTYNTFVDKNNINKVFAEFLEFEIDYSVQTLTGTTGWLLKRSYGPNISVATYDGSPRHQTTLSNGKTYGFIRNGGDFEIVEFPTTGQIRFTGVFTTHGLGSVLCSDGSIQAYDEVGTTAYFKRYPLTGFDGSNNPIWSSTAEILATAVIDNTVGNPVKPPRTQCFSDLNKVVLFNYITYLTYPTAISGYHLGLMNRNANNVYLWKTEKSTHKNYEGRYPGAGWYDVGNFVNDNGGGQANIVDRNIITSYHGEFWKNSQTNKFNHYYDNGLAIGQFGVTGPEKTYSAYPMMAGNANSPIAVKDGSTNLYVWHGDESQHAGIHRWKVSGLDTISEQTATVSFPSTYVAPILSYTDLMSGLPFDTSMVNNTNGWTRTPTTDILTDRYNDYCRVYCGQLSYDYAKENDVTMVSTIPLPSTYLTQRNLGTINVTYNWKITGLFCLPDGSNVNGGKNNQFFEILDDADKVLVRIYITGSYQNPSFLYANTSLVATAASGVIEKAISLPVPITIEMIAGVLSVTIANYTTVTPTIFDGTANWHKPKTISMRQVRDTGAGSVQGQSMALQNLKLYKDY